jgi:hypothetical protein
MEIIQQLYLQFLSMFPEWLRPLVSVGLAVLLLYSVVQTIKRDFIWLIALVILLPASVPILRNIGQGIVEFIKFLLGTR